LHVVHAPTFDPSAEGNHADQETLTFPVKSCVIPLR